MLIQIVNKIGDMGAFKISEALKINTTLTKLDLHGGEKKKLPLKMIKASHNSKKETKYIKLERMQSNQHGVPETVLSYCKTIQF